MAFGDYDSKYFRRRYEGYMEKTARGKDGRDKIERVYIGSYYSLAASDKKALALKIIYPALFVLSAALFFWGESIDAASGMVKPLQIFVFAAVMVMIYYAVTIVRYVTHKREMVIWEYKSGPRDVKLVGAAVALAEAVNCGVAVYFAIAAENPAPEVKKAIFCAFSAAITLAIVIIESRQKYSQRPSETEFVKGGFYIN